MKDVLNRSLLFPIRIRQNGMNTYILNLTSSNQYFSAGPRMCVGYSYVLQITDLLCKLLSDCIISTNDETIVVNKNKDLPFVLSDWTIYLYSKSYFKKYSDDNKLFVESGDTRLYDMCRIYSDVTLMNCFYSFMNVYKNKFDVIISPESRGYPFAGALSALTQKPLYLIRKEGKVFGPKVSKLLSVGYKKKSEIIEISSQISITGKNILFVDDGIASFSTTHSCIELMNELGGNIKLIVALVEHSYCEKIKEYDNYKDITITFQKF